MTLDLGGKQVVISSDLGTIRLSLWANKGSLGIQITPKEAIRIRAALLAAILDAEKPTPSPAP